MKIKDVIQIPFKSWTKAGVIGPNYVGSNVILCRLN